MKSSKGRLVESVEDLRREARMHTADGALTSNYEGDLQTTIRMLNSALAAEIVCILRYKFHAVTACGIDSDAVRAEFLEHALQEEAHADRIAKRITQLGGRPDMNPATLVARSATEYREGNDLADMITEDLVAERIAVQSYRGWIRVLGSGDPTTRRLLEDILAQEEEHANDLLDLLIARQGAGFGGPSSAFEEEIDIERAEGEGMQSHNGAG